MIDKTSIEIGRKLTLEITTWENFKPNVCIDYVNDGCYSCSNQDISVDIDRDTAKQIVDALKKVYDL